MYIYTTAILSLWIALYSVHCNIYSNAYLITDRLHYLIFTSYTFYIHIYTTKGLSGFRGTMDVVTPLKISLFANLVNLVLDPVLMFSANMGTLAYYLLCGLYAVYYACICSL